MTLLRDVAVAVLVVTAASSATSAQPAAIETRDDRALRLGDHFYDDAQFYRAIGAYEELALFTADPELASYARLRIAMALQRGGQHADAVAAYDRWLAASTSTSTSTSTSGRALAGWVRIQRALARAADAEDTGRTHLDDIVAELAPLATIDGEARPTAAYHLARLQILGGQRAEARLTLADARTRCAARPVDDCGAIARVERAASIAAPRRRSPALAIALSAALPGAGSFYTGHHVDGIYYLALTSASVLGALDVHVGDRGLDDQKTTFYVLGTVAASTYVAGLVQGYLGARRYNLVQELRWRRRVAAGTETPLPLDAHPERLRGAR